MNSVYPSYVIFPNNNTDAIIVYKHVNCENIKGHQSMQSYARLALHINQRLAYSLSFAVYLPRDQASLLAPDPFLHPAALWIQWRNLPPQCGPPDWQPSSGSAQHSCYCRLDGTHAVNRKITESLLVIISTAQMHEGIKLPGHYNAW